MNMEMKMKDGYNICSPFILITKYLFERKSVMGKRFADLFWLLLFCFLSIGLMVGIGKYMERAACAKMIRGYEADYAYYDRSLSVSDFEQFDYDSTYEEMIERLGMPNGLLYISMALPYYELKDGRFAVCSFTEKTYIYIANNENVEYFLLPHQLKQKSDTIKEREVETARQSEMNIVLWMLEIEDWEQSLDNHEDVPMGEYSAEKLKQYTDRDIKADISYYFGTYHESALLPLIQLVWIYEEQKPIGLGYALWDTNMNFHMWYIEDDAEYMEDGGDWVDIVGKYGLKGRKELLNIDGKDTDLTSINLSPDKIANSLTEFLVKQKVIRSRRNARVELWGEDGNGKYMCLLITSPWEKGWGINVYSKGTKYYFVTIDTLDDNAVSVKVALLERKLYGERVRDF